MRSAVVASITAALRPSDWHSEHVFRPDELLTVCDAIDALQSARDSGTRVLGIDAFTEPLRPSLD